MTPPKEIFAPIGLLYQPLAGKQAKHQIKAIRLPVLLVLAATDEDAMLKCFSGVAGLAKNCSITVDRPGQVSRESAVCKSQRRTDLSPD